MIHHEDLTDALFTADIIQLGLSELVLLDNERHIFAQIGNSALQSDAYELHKQHMITNAKGIHEISETINLPDVEMQADKLTELSKSPLVPDHEIKEKAAALRLHGEQLAALLPFAAATLQAHAESSATTIESNVGHMHKLTEEQSGLLTDLESILSIYNEPIRSRRVAQFLLDTAPDYSQEPEKAAPVNEVATELEPEQSAQTELLQSLNTTEKVGSQLRTQKPKDRLIEYFCKFRGQPILLVDLRDVVFKHTETKLTPTQQQTYISNYVRPEQAAYKGLQRGPLKKAGLVLQFGTLESDGNTPGRKRKRSAVKSLGKEDIAKSSSNRQKVDDGILKWREISTEIIQTLTED